MNRHLKIFFLAAFATLPGATFADVTCPADIIWMNCTNGVWTAYVPYDGFKQLDPKTPCSSTPNTSGPSHTGKGTTYYFQGQIQVATAVRHSNRTQPPCNYSKATYDQLKCTYNADIKSSSPTSHAVVLQRIHSGKDASFNKCSRWSVGSTSLNWGYPNMYYCYGDIHNCKGVHTGLSGGGFLPAK